MDAVCLCTLLVVALQSRSAEAADRRFLASTVVVQAAVEVLADPTGNSTENNVIKNRSFGESSANSSWDFNQSSGHIGAESVTEVVEENSWDQKPSSSGQSDADNSTKVVEENRTDDGDVENYTDASTTTTTISSLSPHHAISFGQIISGGPSETRSVGHQPKPLFGAEGDRARAGQGLPCEGFAFLLVSVFVIVLAGACCCLGRCGDPSKGFRKLADDARTPRRLGRSLSADQPFERLH